MTDGFPASGSGGAWEEWRNHVLSELAAIKADVKSVKLAVHGGNGHVGLATQVDRNTQCRVRLEDSMLKYKIAIFGAFASGMASLVYSLIRAGLNGR